MKKRKGSILVAALVGTMIFAILSVGALSATLSIHSRAQKYKNETQAYYTASSVAEFFAAQIAEETQEGAAILAAALDSGSASISGVSLPDTMGECDLQISCAKQSFTVDAVETTLWELRMTAESSFGEATGKATLVMRNYTGDYEIGSEPGGAPSITVPAMPPGAMGGAWQTGLTLYGWSTIVSAEEGPYYIAYNNQKLNTVYPDQSTDDMIYIFVPGGVKVHLNDVLAVSGLFGTHLLADKAVVSIIVEPGGTLIFNGNSTETIYAYIYLLDDDPEGQVNGASNKLHLIGGLYTNGKVYETGETFKGMSVVNRFGEISWSNGLPAGVAVTNPSIIRYE